MAQFKHSRLSKLARMRYWGTSRKGLVTSAAGDSRLRGQRKGPTHTHTPPHTRLLCPENFTGIRENHRGDVAGKCLAWHLNALKAFQIASLICGAHHTLPSCFVLRKCHIFLKRSLVYYLVGTVGFFFYILRAANNSDPPFKNNPPLTKKKSERLTNGSNSKYLN